MAYFDFIGAKHREDSLEKYNELKKEIGLADKGGSMHEYFLALNHLNNMEDEIANQKEEIEKYKNFFRLLKGLLPNEHSIYDNIG